MVDLLLFVVGVALLIKGADFLVSGASSFARRYGVSEIVIGLTIVAFGTSMPEFLVSVVAGLRGNSEIVIGNVVGSNICNILLILGVSAAIQPVAAKSNTVFREIPFMMLATVVVTFQLNDALLDAGALSTLDRTDGLVLLGFFSVFLYYIALAIRSERQTEREADASVQSGLRSAILIAAGLAGLIIGGRVTVDSAVGLSQSWGMSERFVGLTVVAVGTSLPELATSAVAAYRKRSDIAIGNVVGSNIFNIFFVLGVPSLIAPIDFVDSANPDLLVMNLATLALLATMFIGRPPKTVQRSEGIVFLVLYTAYIGYTAFRG